jgi:hypothetical protein
MLSKAKRLEVKCIVLVCEVGESENVDGRKSSDARGDLGALIRRISLFLSFVSLAVSRYYFPVPVP